MRLTEDRLRSELSYEAALASQRTADCHGVVQAYSELKDAAEASLAQTEQQFATHKSDSAP